MKKNAKKTVILTWQTPWQADLPEHIEVLQLALTATRPIHCPHLVTDLSRKMEVDQSCLLFFSKAGINGFFHNLPKDKSVSLFKAAAVGAQTAQALKEKGFNVIYQGKSTAIEMVKSLVDSHPQIKLWIIGGNLGGEAVIDFLNEKDITFSSYCVYENYEPEGARQKIENHLPDVEAICLASPSAATRLLQGCKRRSMPKLFSIGPATSKRVEELGFKVFWQAEEPGFRAFLGPIKKYLTKAPNSQ